MIQIIENSGFHMTFDNGNTISIQIGPGAHCSNKNCDDHYAPISQEKWKSYTAEIAAWDSAGHYHEWTGHERNDTTYNILSYVPTDKLPEIIAFVSSNTLDTKRAKKDEAIRLAEQKIMEKASHLSDNFHVAIENAPKEHETKAILLTKRFAEKDLWLGLYNRTRYDGESPEEWEDPTRLYEIVKEVVQEKLLPKIISTIHQSYHFCHDYEDIASQYTFLVETKK
jgi:hypothetical protein